MLCTNFGWGILFLLGLRVNSIYSIDARNKLLTTETTQLNPTLIYHATGVPQQNINSHCSYKRTW